MLHTSIKKYEEDTDAPMATDQSQATQPAMEDILSSIRTGVVEETAKVGSGSADLIDAAAAQDGEEDVLDLSPEDMVAAPATSEESDELIDISAFASSGESKPANNQSAAELAAELLGESSTPATPAATPAVEGGASDEFDRLLAEISQEQQQQVAAAEVSKQALMDEEDPLGTPDADAMLDPESEVSTEVEQFAETIETAAAAELSGAISGGASNFKLGLVEGPEGVQIAFPAEVLAMALRPMVQDWLTKNLPGVVEKLVKEEISKLTQN